MRHHRRNLATVAGLALGLTLLASVGVPGIAAATPPPLYPQCPAAGADTGCAVLVTVNADGTTSVATDPAQPPMSPTAVLVGFVNNSNAVVNSVALQGTTAPGAFSLTGQGVCAVHPGPCFSATEFGPTGYEGPGTSLAPAAGDATSGTVNFASGMAPGTGTYFSLRSAPITVTSLNLVSDLSATATPVAAFANIPYTGQVGTFTVGYSTSPVGDFAATLNWGDGTTSAVTISQPGGAGTPYVVNGTHTYAAPTTVTTTLSVTDTALPGNSGTSSSTATVVPQPVTLAPVTFANQVVGTAFSGQVATFTSDDPTTTPASFSASIDWGAQAGGVEQVSAGTVTQPGGPGTPFSVAASNTYAVSGAFTVTVSVTVNGVTSTITEPIQVDVAQVTVPCTGTCTGQVTTPLEQSTGTTNSPSGSIFVSLSDGALLCGGNYDYAPQITTVTTTGISSSALVKVKVTFLRRDLQGPAGAPVAVCFESNHPFIQKDGTMTTGVVVNGQTQYIGLLPKCLPSTPQRFGPCLAFASLPSRFWQTAQERIKFPAGDPRFH